MALVVADRVKEVTTTTGTGAISLGGAQSSFVAFSSALSDGDTTYYAIVDNNNVDYEVGLGTYASSGNTLTRTTVLDSSNSGSAVSFGAGQKDVFITYPADKSLRLDANDKIAGNQTFSGTVTLNADPASGLQAATKQYVDDTAAEGIQYHSPVRVEQEGNLTVTYDNGTAGVGATLTNAGTQAALVIDDITMVVSDRVLIYEQTDATQNGVYTVTDVGSASTNWVLTRATDADSYAPSDPNALAQGSGFFVAEGTLGAGEKYVCNTVGTITFGTTDITFVQVATAQIYTAGTGISISGSVISSDATLAEVTANGTSTTDNLTLAGITVNSFAMGSAYSLPTADGTANQVLQTNGSGTVSFAAASTPTLDSVTDAGNNTANSITVGDINASNLSCNALTSNGIDDNATSTAITIDSDERVGINITPTNRTFEVNAIGAAQIISSFETASTVSGRIAVLDANTTADNSVGIGSTGNNLDLYAGAAARATLSSSGALSVTGGLTVDTDSLVVDATNNRVGIGVASPSKTLVAYHEVAATVLINAASSVSFSNGNNSTANIRFQNSGSNFKMYSTDGLEKTVTYSGTLTVYYDGMFGSYSTTASATSPITLPADGTQVTIASDSSGDPMVEAPSSMTATSITIESPNEDTLTFDYQGLSVGNGTFTDLTAAGIKFAGNPTSKSMTISGHTNLGNQSSTGFGYDAFSSITSGSNNTAIGSSTLFKLTYGQSNTAVGNYANYNCITGYYNTAIGASACQNTTAFGNTGVGYSALQNTSSANYNTGIGYTAGRNLTTGGNSTCIGNNAQPSSSSTSNQITLGNSSVNSLRCNSTSISSLSDARDKTNVQDIPLGLDFINKMRPVSFDWQRRDGSYKEKCDFGFIAQELDEISKESGYQKHLRLVLDDNPDRLEAAPMQTYPLLIKAVQELSAQVQCLKKEIEELKNA